MRIDLGLHPEPPRLYTFAVPVLNPAVRAAAALAIEVVSGRAAADEFLRPTYDVLYVTERADAEAYAARLMREPQVPTGFDFETGDRDGVKGWSPAMHRLTLAGEQKYTQTIAPGQPDILLDPVTFQIYRIGEPAHVVAGEHLHLFGRWLRDLAMLDGANLTFESTVIRRRGGRMPRAHRDVIHMDYLGHETTRQGEHGQKDCERDHLGLDPREFSWKDFRAALRDEFLKALDYCAFDAWSARFLGDFLQHDLSRKKTRPGYANLWEYYERIERSIAQNITHMEQAGIPIIEEETRKLDADLAKQIEDVTARAYQAIGRPVNLASDKELGRYFYLEKGYPVTTTTPGWTCLLCDKKITARTDKTCRIHGNGALVNTPSVDEGCLAAIAALGDTVAPIVIERNFIDHMRSSYVEAFFTRSSPVGGTGLYPWEDDAPGLRVHHGNFKAADTAPGRLAAPLALTIPKHGYKQQVGFPEDCGWVLLDVDLSQAELRLAAEFSQDPVLLEAFREKRDMHAWTGALVEAFLVYGQRALDDPDLRVAVYEEVLAAKLGVEKAEKALAKVRAKGVPEKIAAAERILAYARRHLTDPARVAHLVNRRNHGKTLNFAKLYGAGDDKLSQSLGVSVSDARKISAAIDKMYAGLVAWMAAGVKELETDPVMVTLGGRNRTILEVQSPDPKTRAEGERLSTNQRPQCGVRDIIMAAALQIDIDTEAGGAYGTEGRGSYGSWVDGRYVLDPMRLPKRWRDGLTDVLREDLGLIGRCGARVINSIHDELLLICPEAYVDVVGERVVKIMEDPFGDDLRLTVPLVAEKTTGRNWQICKDAG